MTLGPRETPGEAGTGNWDLRLGAKGRSAIELKSVTIRNFKALQNIHLTKIPSFIILVGANGSGKSTLFDVFGFLRDALTGNVRQALDARGRFAEVVTRGHENESILVELQVGLPIAGRLRLVTYHLEVGLESRRPVVLREFLRYKRGRYGAPFYFLDFHNGSGFAIRNEENFDKPDEELKREEQQLESPDILAIKGLSRECPRFCVTPRGVISICVVR